MRAPTFRRAARSCSLGPGNTSRCDNVFRTHRCHILEPRSVLAAAVNKGGRGNMNTATANLEIPSCGRIATVESLREHLQWAIELEHFTLPPYLCALYSLDAA